MNIRTPLLVGTFWAAAAFASGAAAAPETASPQQPVPPAASGPAKAKPAAARHSHMTEKLGIPVNPANQHATGDAAAPDGKDEKALPRHNHQRDMK